MKVHLEHLYHYCCDFCQKWWTIADIKPSSETICPHCGKRNPIEGIESHDNTISITAPNPEAAKKAIAQIPEENLTWPRCGKTISSADASDPVLDEALELEILKLIKEEKLSPIEVLAKLSPKYSEKQIGEAALLLAEKVYTEQNRIWCLQAKEKLIEDFQSGGKIEPPETSKPKNLKKFHFGA